MPGSVLHLKFSLIYKNQLNERDVEIVPGFYTSHQVRHGTASMKS